ncbi:MAG: universal stress protein [Desulforhopalus sp.]|jgi:nucleotide-binding universal stress UspA family protein|nr:universal stress protein [Desulforhopalus sp.]
MKKIEKMVVPVDFYQHTDGLVGFAMDVANQMGAKITFLHVVEPVGEGINYFGEYPASFADVNEEIFERAESQMAALVKKCEVTSPGCSGLVLKGDVTDGILDYVKGKASDLLVMGTHGYRGIQKIVLGSVADRVLKRASCPILIFNPYKGEVS